jgi:hypothetical protein
MLKFSFCRCKTSVSPARNVVMARYYFDVRDNDDLYQDDEGVDVSGAEVIKKQAALSLLEIAMEHAERRLRSDLSIEVRDEASRPVIRVVLSFEIQILDDLGNAPSLH